VAVPDGWRIERDGDWVSIAAPDGTGIKVRSAANADVVNDSATLLVKLADAMIAAAPSAPAVPVAGISTELTAEILGSLCDLAHGHLTPGQCWEEITAFAAPAVPVGDGWVTPAITAVIQERRRQVEQEHWTPTHDDAHGSGELAMAGACYALNATGIPSYLIDPDASGVPMPWPWEAGWWKPKDERRDLVRAAALILAEIERLDRATASPAATKGA
jgi:hypothetical protein